MHPSAPFPRISLPLALLIAFGMIACHSRDSVWMGRIPICQCGYVKLWHGGRGTRKCRSTSPIGTPTATSCTAWCSTSCCGAIFRGRLSVAARLVIATLIEGAWEIFENTPFIINRYRTQTISRDYYGDTIINSVGDMVAMVVGFLLSARLPAWITVMLLIATEVGLLYLIRDNLLLNIIMLIYPLEWIKQWQAGG